MEVPGVVVVNEAFTEKFGLDDVRALGKRMALGSSPDQELDLEIGVVLAPRKLPVHSDPVVFILHRTAFEIGIYPPGGPPRLPDTLMGVIELKAPRSLRWLERRPMR